MHGIPVERYTSRPETAQSYTGGASVMYPAEYAKGEYMESKHQDLGQLPFAPVSAANRGDAREGDYEMRAKTAYPNNRTTTTGYGEAYFGAFSGGGSIGAVIAPLLDMLRPSRKENLVVENNLRPYQNAQPQMKSTYVFNESDHLPTTIRETTQQNQTYHLNIQPNMYASGAYSTCEMQPVHNQRDTTTEFSYIGIAGATEGTRGLRPYDAEYRQRNNDLKSSTIAGHMVPGHMATFNHDVNNFSAKPKDRDLLNSRSVQGTYPSQFPSVASMGQYPRDNHARPEHPPDDRNISEDLIAQLRDNPYTLDIRKAI